MSYFRFKRTGPILISQVTTKDISELEEITYYQLPYWAIDGLNTRGHAASGDEMIVSMIKTDRGVSHNTLKKLIGDYIKIIKLKEFLI